MLTITVNDSLVAFEKDNPILSQITEQVATHNIPFIDGKLSVVVMDDRTINYSSVYENKESTLTDLCYLQENDAEWFYQAVEINGYWFIEVYDEKNEFVSYWGG